jgi:hypothetical protein
VLHSFNGTPECCPSSITRDVAGNLYGTTGGTVFKLTLKNGSYTFSDLYSNSPYPYLYMGSATLDSKGNLYGTAYLCTSSACVWEIPAGGTWTEFWDSGNSTDTFFSNITIDKNGSLYVGELDFASTFSAWVQEIGGNYDTYESGGGYEMPVWLRQDASGNIYALAVGYEQNTYSEVFKIDITTGNISVLYTFVGGSLPSGAFSLDSTGNIYGMAYGKNWFIFKITSRGVLTNLYAGIALLNGNVGVVMDKSGNLYGCGATGLGSVFKLAKQ